MEKRRRRGRAWGTKTEPVESGTAAGGKAHRSWRRAVVVVAAIGCLGVTLSACWGIESERRLVTSTADMPDPSAIVVGGSTYVFTTNVWVFRFPMWRVGANGSADLLGDALPGAHPVPWAADRSNEWWAPSVNSFNGKYYLYFTAPHPTLTRCIGVATASSVTGPYTAKPDPVACAWLPGGAIDPDVMTYNGTRYLLFSAGDKNTPARIFAVRLTADGFHTSGSPVVLLTAGLDSTDAGVVENPSMVATPNHDGHSVHLMYSRNDWTSGNYATGLAYCPQGPTAPCSRENTAFLMSSGNRVGPGGADVIEGTSLMLVYHAWDPGAVGYGAGVRRDWTAHMKWYS